MELPKKNSRNISAEKNLSDIGVYTTKSGSRMVLDETDSSSPEDIIMSDESYNNEDSIQDTPMSDGYTDETHNSDTTIHYPSSGLAPTAPAPKPRYVPAPRRYQGILDPKESAEDAAFFARANRQYQQKIQEAVLEDEMKAKEDNSGAAEERKAALTARANAASKAEKNINFIDIFWGDS